MDMTMKNMSKWQVFEYIFHVLCLFTTTALVGYWMYKFSMDEDLSVLEYKQYDMKDVNDTSNSPYLSQTICFRNPFITSKKTHLNSSEKHRVEAFLAGSEDVEYPDFDYNSLAMNLTDYVKKYYIRWRNGTRQHYDDSDIPWKMVYHGFNGFYVGKFFRCFTLKTPSSDVVASYILIDNQVHNEGMFSLNLTFLRSFPFERITLICLKPFSLSSKTMFEG